jgi:membrane associated rhomboid family serine protease
VLLPIGDDNTQRVSYPVVTTILIVINVLVFLLELFVGDAFVHKYSLIPADFIAGKQPFTNLITSMFLHGGPAHIIGNMLYLYVFGDNVEDNLGKVKYILFYFACGIVSMLAQTYAMPDSHVQNLGASGAIAGVLAGYLILFPHNRVRVLIFFPFIVNMQAEFVLGLWILTQLVSGWTSQYQQAGATGGGIAYMAHIAGFFTGVVLTFLFRRREAADGSMHRLGIRRIE